MPQPLLIQSSILDEARQIAGHDDFGPDYFLEPMAKLLESINEEARLSAAGAEIQRKRMVGHMVARLRMFDAIARHPEIEQEPLDVAAMICGMPRTGSTMVHRMLATAPGFTAVRWWEAQNYAPFPDEVRGRPVERRREAERIMDLYVKAGMMSIHPFAIDAPDEEIVILDQLFVGTMPENGMYVPSFSAWLNGYDHRAAYQDLKTVLKFLQWQDVSRRGKRWVLKTPGHLPTIENAAETFPDAVLIMTHRDPRQTIPSYCSMTETLYRMYCDTADPVELGRFTEARWAGFLKHFTVARDRLASQRFIDVRYDDLIADPLLQARLILSRLGIDVTPEIQATMQDWLAENAREKRAQHHYDAQHFGLTNSGIDRDFALYKERFGV